MILVWLVKLMEKLLAATKEKTRESNTYSKKLKWYIAKVYALLTDGFDEGDTHQSRNDNQNDSGKEG